MAIVAPSRFKPSKLSSLRGSELSAFRRDRLGFIFQDANLLDTLTARENIALSLTIGHIRAQEVLERVDVVAKLLQITDVLDKFPYEMSGGQRQRVAARKAREMVRVRFDSAWEA